MKRTGSAVKRGEKRALKQTHKLAWESTAFHVINYQLERNARSHADLLTTQTQFLPTNSGISKAKDEAGNEIEILQEFTTANGLRLVDSAQIEDNTDAFSFLFSCQSHPKPFRCSIEPRNASAASLIRSVLVEHPYDRDDSKKVHA